MIFAQRIFYRVLYDAIVRDIFTSFEASYLEKLLVTAAMFWLKRFPPSPFQMLRNSVLLHKTSNLGKIFVYF